MSIMFAATLAVGCASDRPKPSRAALAEATQHVDESVRMSSDGQRLRADGLAKKQRGQNADGDREIAQGDQLITQAKLLKDRALLKANPAPDE